MSITIIFNPVSTGDSEKNARLLQKRLKHKALLVPTESAGHAEHIAYDIAKNMKPVVIIASSGDGGYHEVLNGVMRAGNKGVVVGTIPSGNANDHHRNAYTQPVHKSINNKQYKKIDVLHITSVLGKKTNLDKYAHSYAGLGVSSAVAIAINEGAKTNFKEKVAAVKTFLTFKPFRIVMDGKYMQLDSMIISNIPEMAKNLRLADNISISDGRFGLSLHHHVSRLNLARYFARTRFAGTRSDNTETKITFTVMRSTDIQMDGEVYKLPAGSDVTVESLPGAITTFS